MLTNVVVLFLLLSVTCSCYSQFTPVDKYLINSGSPTNVSIGNRMFLSENFTQGYLITSRNVLVHTFVNSIPLSEFSQLYSTARIFTNSSFYFFVIDQPGRHWIRLYFYPFSASGNDLTTAVFSVSTSENLLLSNFSCSNSSVKEFSVNVTSNGLQITFTPARGSFGFLNGLEVVSVPDQLIGDYATYVDNHTNFRGLSSQVLETSSRVNVGGTFVSSGNDSLWRTWVPDQPFLVNPSLATNVSNTNAVRYPGDGGATQDDAPQSVYGTAVKVASPKSNLNVSWEFPVESGFKYFVRLHFCDIESVSAKDLYFNVYIQDWRVLSDFNLSSRLTTAYYADFVTPSISTNNIRISIGPSGVRYAAILNGVEIMKLNNSDGTDVPASNKRAESEAVVIVEVVVCAIVGVSIAFALFFFIKRRIQERLNQSKTRIQLSTNEKCSSGITLSAGSDYSNRLPFATIEEATNHFDESFVIGIGGFGKVYKGVLSDGTKVAIKRGTPESQQGMNEFKTELEMLSQFRHRHLVSLIGFCDEKNEMILVYEYMENGTLKSHLYGSNFPALSWKKRIEICIGSARGLLYLHTGFTKTIIHRDIKSANILLDENLIAKIADFGLSKRRPETGETQVSTGVKGTFGYLDPEYFQGQQLTEKSDVYSFGVVLLEVLCARPVIDTSLPPQNVNIAEWAMRFLKDGQLETIIDVALKGKIHPNSLRMFGETVEKCLSRTGVDRPSMSQVLGALEQVLEHEEAFSTHDPDENSTINETSPRENNPNTNTRVGRYEIESEDDEIFELPTSDVFSQLVNQGGTS